MIPGQQQKGHRMYSKPIITTTADTKHIEFTSIADYIGWATDLEAGFCEDGRKRAAFCLGRTGNWVNYQTPTKLQAALVSCPASLLSAVEDVKRAIEDKVDAPQQRRRKRAHKLEMGDELDPIAWVQRDPAGWSDTHREYRTKQVVKIGVNTATSNGLDQKHVVFRGAAAVALADVLTAQGFSVEVVLFSASRGADSSHPNQVFVQTSVVKPADAPLDVSTAAVCLAEIGFRRLIGLAVECRACVGEPNIGLGQPVTLPSEFRKGFDVIIDYNVSRMDQAVTVVLEALAAVSGK